MRAWAIEWRALCSEIRFLSVEFVTSSFHRLPARVFPVVRIFGCPSIFVIVVAYFGTVRRKSCVYVTVHSYLDPRMSGNHSQRWRRASELPPQRPQLDGENANTLNSRHSTGGFGAGLPQKKRVLATTTATAVTTMSKRRMSMKNRRVSFAPDPELTTIREFEKEERESPNVPLQQAGIAQLPEGDPMMISPPQMPTSGFAEPPDGRMSFGDITAGLPTLGELAEEEEEENDSPAGLLGAGRAGWAQGGQMHQHHEDITHQVPGLGALLEEDEMLEEGAGKGVQDQQPAIQENKWGFVPGNDDTLDIDLKGHGRMFMGDKTYNKMYADNITANSLASVDVAPSAEKSVQNVERISFGGDEVRGPNWAAPAFGAPNAANAHPALEQSSPNFTDSSLGTASTRRISVDARRMSVSSRRVSMMRAGGKASADVPSALPQTNANQDNVSNLPGRVANAEDDDDEEDLLADDSPRSMNAKTFDVLAGLKNRMSALSPQKQPRRSSMLPVPEDMEMPAESFHSPTGSGAHVLNRSPPPSAASLGNANAANARRQSILSIGNGRRSLAPYVNPRESIGASMGRTTPGSVTRRTSLNTANTGGTTVLLGANYTLPNTNNGNNGVLSTPMRTNALVSTINPANSASIAPPGSAIAARYPGSAVATGRMSQGFTPSTLPPITFQDFAKIVEVQFLDNLRRGASINYADLQPNPVPSNVKESLSLLCITQPNIEELETAISTLQSEIQRLRGSAADLEVMLGQTNPAIFRHVQTSSYEQLEALRNNVTSLKKACRAKATALLKDVRCQMEESKHGRLSRALEGLKADVAWFHKIKGHTEGISKAAKEFIAEKRQYMAAKRREIAAQTELNGRVMAARKAAADISKANTAREEQLMTIESQANNLDSELAQIEAERVELEAEIQHGRAIVQTASASVVKARQSFSSAQQAEAFLLEDESTVSTKLNMLKIYEKCSGMKIQSCRAMHGAFSCSINVADAFLMEVNYSKDSDGVTIMVKPRASRNEFAMKLFSQRDNCSFACEREALTCVVQALVTQMSQAASAAKELEGIRHEYLNICDLTPVSSQYDALGHRSRMAVRIGCLGMQLGVRFSVTLAVKDLSCLDIDVIFGSEVIGVRQIKDALVNVMGTPSQTKGLGSLAGACGTLCRALVA